VIIAGDCGHDFDRNCLSGPASFIPESGCGAHRESVRPDWSMGEARKPGCAADWARTNSMLAFGFGGQTGGRSCFPRRGVDGVLRRHTRPEGKEPQRAPRGLPDAAGVPGEGLGATMSTRPGSAARESQAPEDVTTTGAELGDLAGRLLAALAAGGIAVSGLDWSTLRRILPAWGRPGARWPRDLRPRHAARAGDGLPRLRPIRLRDRAHGTRGRSWRPTARKRAQRTRSSRSFRPACVRAYWSRCRLTQARRRQPRESLRFAAVGYGRPWRNTAALRHPGAAAVFVPLRRMTTPSTRVALVARVNTRLRRQHTCRVCRSRNANMP
jgi:hypothetical protein